MNTPVVPFPRDVPLVGQPLKIAAHYPTVVVECQCEAKCIVVLIGTNTPNACPACRQTFVILDEMQVRVGVMRTEAPVLQ